MMSRGVQKQDSVMATATFLGEIQSNPQIRAEYLEMIRTKR